MSDCEVSDDELREILALKGPGLYRKEENAKQKVAINKAGLEVALEALTKRHLPWLERLDITIGVVASSDITVDNVEPTSTKESNDDFKREAYFQQQAATAATIGLQRLYSEKVPIQRPVNYLAEMAKSDGHMRKVRETLVSHQRQLELREKARSLRESRKYGKKVQREVKAKKQQERSDFLRAVKSYKKGKLDGGQLDELLSGKGRSANEINEQVRQATTSAVHKSNKKGAVASGAVGNKKRAFKNKRFGFGGQKKRSKYNTKESAGGYVRDFSVSKHNSTPAKAAKIAMTTKKQKKSVNRKHNKSSSR